MRRFSCVLLASLSLCAACGDEDTGGGPAGGFDDRAPEAPGSDDGDDRSSSSTIGVDSETDAGSPSGGIGDVEGDGDVNDLGEDDGTSDGS